MPDSQGSFGLLLSRLPWSCALEAQGPELQGKRQARRPATETKTGQERSESMIYKRGKSSGRGTAAKQAFNEAMDAYIERRKLFSAPKTNVTDRERSKTLRAFFGD